MTRKRKLHLLRTRAGTACPTCVCVLACDLQEEPPDSPGGRVRFQCEKAALAEFHLEKGRACRHALTLGTPERIEKQLREACSKHKSIWLFAAGLYRQLLAVGLLDKIGAGLPWTLGPDDSQGDNGRRRRRQAWRGFAVLEEKCAILCVRNRNGGMLHAVDTANFAGPSRSEVDAYLASPELIEITPWSAMARLSKTHCIYEACGLAVWVDAYLSLVRKHNLGSLQHTLASQAMYAFRRSHLKEHVLVHDYESVLELERAALYGGRNECRFIGLAVNHYWPCDSVSRYGHAVPVREVNGPIYHLDATSLYCGLALVSQVPVALVSASAFMPRRLSDDWLSAIADVSVETETPCLPKRERLTGELLFPTGRFRTTLCGPELMIARDKIVQVHSVARYRMAPLFESWANFTWALRQHVQNSGKPFLDRVAKSLCQVLYGKFGQTGRGWRGVSGVVPPGDWACWYTWDEEHDCVQPWRSLAGRVEKLSVDGEPPESVPALAAWIASLGRAWLWGVILTAGAENVLYCDTDSVFVTLAGLDRLQNSVFFGPGQLGKLRIVGSHKEVEFCGLKHYFADGALTCAGVPPPIGCLAGYGRIQYTTQTVMEACRAGRPPERVMVPMHARRLFNYSHGNVQGDGTVTPIVIGDYR